MPRDGRRFLREIERRADLGRTDHGKRPLREAVEAGQNLVVLAQRVEGMVETLEQVLAAIEIGERDAAVEREAADFQLLARLGRLSRVQRAVFHAQEAGRFIAAGHGDEGRQIGRAGQFAADYRAVAGILQRRQRAVAGGHIFRAEAVVGQRVTDAAKDGELVRALGQLGQVLAEADAGDLGGDLLELAAVRVRGGGLHVERVEVARAAAEANEDRRLGLGRADLARLGYLQILCQAHADTGQAADADEVTSVDAVADRWTWELPCNDSQ